MIRRSPRYQSPAPNNVSANENPDNGIIEQSTPGPGNVSSDIYSTSANTSSNEAISNAANLNNGKRKMQAKYNKAAILIQTVLR